MIGKCHESLNQIKSRRTETSERLVVNGREVVRAETELACGGKKLQSAHYRVERSAGVFRSVPEKGGIGNPDSSKTIQFIDFMNVMGID